MKREVLLCVVALAACPPPGPGETRCYTSGGFTRCKSGPTQVQADVNVNGGFQPAYAPPPSGWWCSVRPDGFGFCMRRPGDCEVARAKGGAGDGSNQGFGACGFLQTAFCANYQCFTTPAGCVQFERFEKRDGSACVAVQ